MPGTNAWKKPVTSSSTDSVLPSEPPPLTSPRKDRIFPCSLSLFLSSRLVRSLLVFYIPGSLQPFFPFRRPWVSASFPSLPISSDFGETCSAGGGERQEKRRGSPAAEMRSYLEKLRDLPPGQVVFGVAAAHAAWWRKGRWRAIGVAWVALSSSALPRLWSFPLRPSAPVLVPCKNRSLLEGEAIREKQQQRLRFLARAAFTLPV